MSQFQGSAQVKQYLAVIRGQYSDFMVFTTGDPRMYLFAQLYRGKLVQTGLQFPVAKADLNDDVRHALAHGVGYQSGKAR